MSISLCTFMHECNHLRLMSELLPHEAGNWTEHNDLKKKSIIDYYIWPPFMWICSQLLSRGLNVYTSVD